MNAATTATQSAPRLREIDIFRGVAILAVVAIHVCTLLLPTLAKGGAAWGILATADTVLLFAVPGFLMVSAAVLTQSLSRRFDLSRYVRIRSQQALYPYLLWSVVYGFVASRVMPEFTWQDFGRRLLLGKSVYHLYFLGVLLQLYAALPFLRSAFRPNLPLWKALAPAIFATACFFVFNRTVLHLEYVGSVLFWYAPAVGLGIGLGMRLESLTETLHRGFWRALTLAALALVFYIPLNLRVLQSKDANALAFQIAEWIYVTSAAFCLLCLAAKMAKNAPLSSALIALGTRSMQVYLLHPLILGALHRLHLPERIGVWLSAALYLIVAVTLSLAAAEAAKRLQASVFLFGR